MNKQDSLPRIGRTYPVGSAFYTIKDDYPVTPLLATSVQSPDYLNPWVYALITLVTVVVAMGCIWAC